MAKLRGSSIDSPNEDSFRWDYFVSSGGVPHLDRGVYVLVDWNGRNRVAVVLSKIPGGCYWAQLTVPLGGQTRVIVSKHSLRAVASNA